jgi:hypothetical protein
MPSKITYWVKFERSLFRKPEWSVKFNNTKIGLHADRDEAVASAVEEAERTSLLDRASEIWIDEGHGFTLYKAFKAIKAKGEEEGDEDGEGPGDDLSVDESAYL